LLNKYKNSNQTLSAHSNGTCAACLALLDSSQNIKPWSDLRIFTNRDQELELTTNDTATIEHLLVEDVVSDGGSAFSPARRKATTVKSPEKKIRLETLSLNITLLFLDQHQW
jgi:hypothetical protein